MKDLDNYLTDIQTFQDLGKQVSNISTSWHPENLDFTTGQCFTNGIVADRQMIIPESRFKHGDTIDHRIIVYIHVSKTFDLHAKHLKLVGQGLDFFTCNVTTDDFRAKWRSFYGVLELAVPAGERTVNINDDTKVQVTGNLFTSVIRIEKNVIGTGGPSGSSMLGVNSSS